MGPREDHGRTTEESGQTESHWISMGDHRKTTGGLWGTSAGPRLLSEACAKLTRAESSPNHALSSPLSSPQSPASQNGPGPEKTNGGQRAHHGRTTGGLREAYGRPTGGPREDYGRITIGQRVHGGTTWGPLMFFEAGAELTSPSITSIIPPTKTVHGNHGRKTEDYGRTTRRNTGGLREDNREEHGRNTGGSRGQHECVSGPLQS